MSAKYPGAALPLCSELTAEQRKFMPCREEMPAENVRPLVGGAHTPGPWEVRPCLLTKNLDICLPVKSGKAAVISTAWGNEANARLIAAAPELLKALVTLRDYGCPACGGDCASANPPVISCPMQQACTAIAKARGASCTCGDSAMVGNECKSCGARVGA